MNIEITSAFLILSEPKLNSQFKESASDFNVYS